MTDHEFDREWSEYEKDELEGVKEKSQDLIIIS